MAPLLPVHSPATSACPGGSSRIELQRCRRSRKGGVTFAAREAGSRLMAGIGDAGQRRCAHARRSKGPKVQTLPLRRLLPRPLWPLRARPCLLMKCLWKAGEVLFFAGQETASGHLSRPDGRVAEGRRRGGGVADAGVGVRVSSFAVRDYSPARLAVFMSRTCCMTCSRL
jgi:hypothetical protein